MRRHCWRNSHLNPDIQRQVAQFTSFLLPITWRLILDLQMRVIWILVSLCGILTRSSGVPVPNGSDGSKCPNVSCSPPIAGAQCTARYERDEGCCPVWYCNQNGMTSTIYGTSNLTSEIGTMSFQRWIIFLQGKAVVGQVGQVGHIHLPPAKMGTTISSLRLLHSPVLARILTKNLAKITTDSDFRF